MKPASAQYKPALIVDCVGICLEDGQEAALQDLEKILDVGRAELREALAGDARVLLTMGQITTSQYWQFVLQTKLGKKLTEIVERNPSLWGNNATYDDVSQQVAYTLEDLILPGYQPIEQVITILKALHRKGYPIGMISNTSEQRGHEWQKRYPELFGLFRTIRFSYLPPNPGRKPNQMIEMLEEVAHKLKVELRETVYIDDKLTNATTSLEAGLKAAVWVNDKGLIAGSKYPETLLIATRDNLGKTLSSLGFVT